MLSLVVSIVFHCQWSSGVFLVLVHPMKTVNIFTSLLLVNNFYSDVISVTMAALETHKEKL